jgi:hypothetical protein
MITTKQIKNNNLGHYNMTYLHNTIKNLLIFTLSKPFFAMIFGIVIGAGITAVYISGFTIYEKKSKNDSEFIGYKPASHELGDYPMITSLDYEHVRIRKDERVTLITNHNYKEIKKMIDSCVIADPQGDFAIGNVVGYGIGGIPCPDGHLSHFIVYNSNGKYVKIIPYKQN